VLLESAACVPSIMQVIVVCAAVRYCTLACFMFGGVGWSGVLCSPVACHLL
jgi:hypothetical protein